MKRKLTGRSILLWLAGFFGIIVAVNVVFVWTSIATYRGEDEQKPYLQGIEFNRTLDRRAEQARLGWTSRIAAQRLASGILQVTVILKNASGTPQSVAGLFGELRHPADENRDRRLRLIERSKGAYEARVSGVSAGAWDVLIATAPGDVPFEASERLWLR